MSAWLAVSNGLLDIIGGKSQNARERGRWRRALATTGTSFAGRGLTVAAGFVSVPLTLRYLGAERYGVWMTITSTVVLMSFADLGLGGGVVNAVARASASGDRERAREVVSSVFFLLAGVGAVIAGAFMALAHVVPWHRIFNVTSPAARLELIPSMAIIVACFSLGLPLGIVQRVQVGYQEGYGGNLWQIWGSVAALGALLVVIRCGGGLPWLILALTGVPACALLGNFVHQFFLVRPWLRPRWASLSLATCREMMGHGTSFCALTIVAILLGSSDSIIVAQICGSSAVARYAVVAKLFSLTLFVQYFTAPMWPAFSEAQARGDTVWLRTAFRRTAGIAALLTGAICVVLISAGRPLLGIWVGPVMIPPLSLLLGFGFWRFTAGLTEASVALLNTAPLVRWHVLIGSCAGVGSICLRVLAGIHWGLPGIVWASAAAQCALYMTPAILTAEFWLSRQRGHVLGSD